MFILGQKARRKPQNYAISAIVVNTRLIICHDVMYVRYSHSCASNHSVFELLYNSNSIPRTTYSNDALSLFLVVHILTGAPLGSQDSYPGTYPPHRNCSSAALDGVLEIGCWGYTKCVGGVFISHKCPANQVFERDSMTCVE